MEDRNSKRARNRGGGDYPGFALDSMRGGGVGPGQPLAGYHLQVGVATAYLFPGQAVSVQVKLLNDEDVVQKITRDINVTVTGENNKVRPPSPPSTAAVLPCRCEVEFFRNVGNRFFGSSRIDVHQYPVRSRTTTIGWMTLLACLPAFSCCMLHLPVFFCLPRTYWVWVLYTPREREGEWDHLQQSVQQWCTRACRGLRGRKVEKVCTLSCVDLWTHNSCVSMCIRSSPMDMEHTHVIADSPPS